MPDILGAVFPSMHFFSSADLGTHGTDDVALFPVVAEYGCNVFITADMAQTRGRGALNVEERAACREAGLHWVGIPMDTGRGLHAIAGQSASLIHALPFVIDAIDSVSEPHFFRARGPLRQFSQVVNSGPL
jgi:hypothetical protein